MDEEMLRRRCEEADLFLNVSGACWLRDEYRGRGVAAYIDTDPCYSQAKLAAADAGTADEDVRYSAAMIRRHDVFFSFAENIGRATRRKRHDDADRAGRKALRISSRHGQAEPQSKRAQRLQRQLTS